MIFSAKVPGTQRVLMCRARRESGDKPPVHVKGRHSVSASLTSGGQDKGSDQRKLGSQGLRMQNFQVYWGFSGPTGDCGFNQHLLLKKTTA